MGIGVFVLPANILKCANRNRVVNSMGDGFILSGILNIIAALLLVWWSYGALNNILLLIPALLFMAVGCMCIGKAIKKQ